jgi:hypothetical protein
MKLFSLSKWRLSHLLFSWAAYWIALIVIKLGPAIAAARVATQSPGNNTSSVNLNWGTEAGITASVIHHGDTLWAGATTLPAVIGWAVLPPLVLWVVWLLVSSAQRARERQATELLSEGAARDLPISTPVPLHERR